MSIPTPLPVKFLSLDVGEIRSQFPIFERPLPNGAELTYLDSAATAQKPRQVIAKEIECYERYYANAYRGDYQFGVRVDEELEATRKKIQSLIGAAEPEEIIFTSGTTMSINLVAQSWGREFLSAGDEILATQIEHHANLVPWQRIAKERGARLKFIPLGPDGLLDLRTLEELIRPRTKIVAVTGMSNVLGAAPPVEEISRRAKAVGAVVLVDGAQSVPHRAVDVQQSGIDFLAFSGHKLYGPTGVGVLYGRKELLNAMPPFLTGGHMVDRVDWHSSTYQSIPARFEAGTIPIAQAIALGAAVDFVQQVGYPAIEEHDRRLTAYAHRRLLEIPGVTIHGPSPDQKGPIVGFTVDGIHPQDLANLIDRQGVAVRHGHHCTMPLHDLLGCAATVRASFGIYNRETDVDVLVEAIQAARKRLRRD